MDEIRRVWIPVNVSMADVTKFHLKISPLLPPAMTMFYDLIAAAALGSDDKPISFKNELYLKQS
jgi:hypothetical protein